MGDNQKQRVLWKVGIALLPTLIYLVLRFAIHVSESLRPLSWIATAMPVAAAGVVIAVLVRSERQLSPWSLPAIGIGVPTLFLSLQSILWQSFPEGIHNPPPPLYTIGTTVINGLAFMILAGLLVLTAKLARNSGAPAAIAVLTLAGLFSLDLYDPTYGVLIYRPDLVLPVAVIEVLILMPHLIILPLWVLTANSQRQQLMALMLVPGIAYVICLLIEVFFSLPIRQGLSGMSALDALQTRALLTWPMFEGVAWLIQIGIVLLCGWLKRTNPPAALELNAAPGISA
jgi:hypothetical protein